MSALKNLFRLPPMLVLLSACVSTSVPVAPCCYEGPVAVTQISQATITTTSGSTLSIQQALPGYRAQEGFITAPLPFRKADSTEIIYASLIPLLPIYDANRNGILEAPEVLFLYLREAIRGLGIKVGKIGDPAPFRALALPAADVGGLVNYVKARRGKMNQQAQQIFADLDLLGSDLLSKGSQGGADDQGNDFSK